MMLISQCEPHPVESYHYNDRTSQGAFVCQSKHWPLPAPEREFGIGYGVCSMRVAPPRRKPTPSIELPPGMEYSVRYTDRMTMSTRARASAFVGTGDQGWAEKLPELSETRLLEFAQIALELPVLPQSVRVVHWYNVASGYSCPTVEALYAKDWFH